MKVLLINPIMRQWAKPNWICLGLGYVATALERAGHMVRILDLNALRDDPGAPLFKALGEKWDWIGITGLVTSYATIAELVRGIRIFCRDSPIVIGGPIGSYIPRILLEQGIADFVVVGEGEVTAVEFTEWVKDRGAQHATIPGLWWKTADGQVMANAPRKPMSAEQMGQFWPARHLIPMEKYLHNPLGANNKRKWVDGAAEQPVCNTNLIASRGCPYRCIYCAKDFAGTKHRRYSIGSVLAEMQMLKRQYGCTYVNFADDEWMADPGWCDAFCEELAISELDMRWAATGRVNLVNELLLQNMAEAGCIQVAFGIESGSQAMLDVMNKQVTVEQAERAVGMVQRIFGTEGLNVTFMVGLPGETLETMDETLQFCKRTGVRPDNIFFATPYPGTELYAIAQAKGLIDDEVEYILSLGEQGDVIACNCSNIPDDELRMKRDEMLKELRIG